LAAAGGHEKSEIRKKNRKFRKSSANTACREIPPCRSRERKPDCSFQLQHRARFSVDESLWTAMDGSIKVQYEGAIKVTEQR
jgi:hypothetical protein